MNEEDLIRSLRTRILNPRLRCDVRANPPPLFLPVSPGEVMSAEAALGQPLPRLLAKLYRYVANGGFGPGGGLVGLKGGHVDSGGLTLVEIYKLFRGGNDGWSTSVLPLWEGRLPVWFGIDARSADARIVMDDEQGTMSTPYTLHTWLEAWLRNVDLFQHLYALREASAVNPFKSDPDETGPQVRVSAPTTFVKGPAK